MNKESITDRNIRIITKYVGILFIIAIVLIVIAGGILTRGLMPVDENNKEDIIFVIEENTPTNTVISNLKEAGLIRSEFFAKIYIKLNGNTTVNYGTYTLNKSMSVDDIFNEFSSTTAGTLSKTVTFIEGKRFYYMVSTISTSFDISEDEIYELTNNKEYLQGLIDKYWFITDEILDDDIYYPLEGYLFPDTYQFNEDASLEDILTTLIEGLGSKLEPYKEEIEKSDYSVHALLTMASMVELESVWDQKDPEGSKEQTAHLAGVFYNRLSIGQRLGSDVTTYYAVRKELTESLTQVDLDSCNAYNTRGTCVDGLPIGPIASISTYGLNAAIRPSKTDDLYFVADSENKLYFAEDYSGHLKNIEYIQSIGKWPEE